MQVKKITIGFVIQNYINGKCVSQEFVASDEVEYEDENGIPLDYEDIYHDDDEEYQPYDMVQP